MTEKEERELAAATLPNDLDRVIHEEFEIEDVTAEAFIISQQELKRMAGKPDGPIRARVTPMNPDGLKFCWLIKEGEVFRPIQDGDVFAITAEMQADLIAGWMKFSRAEGAERVKDARIEGERRFRLGRRMIFRKRRQTRTFGILAMFFEGEDQTRPGGGYNLCTLKDAGFVAREPEFKELSLTECPEVYLSDRELVIRGLIELNEVNGWIEEGALAHIALVEKAMAKYGVVFYRP